MGSSLGETRIRAESTSITRNCFLSDSGIASINVVLSYLFLSHGKRKYIRTGKNLEKQQEQKTERNRKLKKNVMAELSI